LCGLGRSSSLVLAFLGSPVGLTFEARPLAARRPVCWDRGLRHSCPSHHLRRRIASHAARQGACTSSRFQPKLSPRRCARPASFLSWGSQRPSLHRLAHQVSTPTRRERHASVEGCQLLDSFRPCRFSRLRRLAPPERCGLVASRYRSWDSSRFWFVRRQAALRLQPLRRCVPTHPIRFLEGASLPGLHLSVLVPAPSLLARPCDRGRLACLATEAAWRATQPKLCCPRSPLHSGRSSDRSPWALPARFPGRRSVSSSRSWRPEGRLRLFQPKLVT
jgi:hypothetical protein